MSDLDANGNVINNEPSNTARLKRNATDFRRVVSREGETTVVTVFGNSLGSVAGSTFQRVSDITGIHTCDEGVEIVIHNLGTSSALYTAIGAFRISSGPTGAVEESDRAGLFRISTVATGAQHKGGKFSESVFIPTNDLGRIQLTSLLGQYALYNATAAVASPIEFRIT